MKIRRFIKRVFYYPFNSFKQGIINLKHWFPIIWKDRDYDFSYFETILIHKMKTMKEFYNSEYTSSVGAPELAKQMSEVVELYERSEANNYAEEIDPTIYDDFDKITYVDDSNSTGKKIVFPWDDEERSRKMIIYAQADKKRREDRDRMYDIIKENVESWWD